MELIMKKGRKHEQQVKKSTLVILLMLTFAGAYSQTPAPSTGEDGLKMIEREQPKKGLEALRKEPVNYFALGTGLFMTGNDTEALQVFEKGIAADPKQGLNYAGKGRVMLKQNNVKEAEINFQKAQEISKSKSAEVMAAIAQAWMDKREFAVRAKAAAEKSLGIEPNAKASMILGDFYAMQGDGGKAISNYEYAASKDPKNGAPDYKVGIIYVRSTNKEPALEAFKKAVTVDPTYTLAYKELAKLAYLAKDCENAVKNQQKYMELTEKPEDGLMPMGFYQFMCKDYAKANESFKQTDEKGLLKAKGIRFYANSLSQAGDFAGSAKMFERFFALDSADDEAASDWKTYGEVLQKTGEGKSPAEKKIQDSLASIAYEKSLTIDPKQTKLQEAQADLLLNKVKHSKEAIVAYRKLIALRGKSIAQDLFKLGQAYYYSQMYQQADSTFSQLAVQQPNMTVGYLWAALSNAQMDPESTQGLAKADFEKVIEVGAATPDKSKSDLVKAYSYMGYYYYLQKDLNESLTNWKKVLSLDPNNEQAQTAVKSIEKMKNQPQKQ
jgi:tetratricopeptide (TPR) repeat protein